MKRLINSILVVSACILVGCLDSNPPNNSVYSKPTVSSPVKVCSVNYPLAFFAEKIGGRHVQVSFAAPADEDPAFWQPSKEIIRDFQAADLILKNGADYAGWMKKVSLPESKVLNTSAAFTDKLLKQNASASHQHGPEGSLEHRGLDFTVWLDPNFAVLQAESIMKRLQFLLPKHSNEFQMQFTELKMKLDQLDVSLRNCAVTKNKISLLASHPVYNYLAKRYGWKLKSLHWEPDQMPDESQWKMLKELTTSHPAKIMLWEDEPLPEARKRLQEEFGISIVVFHPCGNKSANEDYLTIMKENIEQFNIQNND